MAAAAASGNVNRVRLPTAADGSFTGATSRTRTLSHCESEAVGGGGAEDAQEQTLVNGTLLLNGAVHSSATFGFAGADGGGVSVMTFAVEEDLRTVVARLEAMQAQQRSPQQPNPELDAEIAEILYAHPEWRPRMAVATKSAQLRQKILAAIPEGGRAVGSAMYGQTHPWRTTKGEYFTDHNWPKASKHNSTGIDHLPGGDATHDRLLRTQAHKLGMNPLLSHTPFHSVPRAKRFPGTKDNGELDEKHVQRRGNPGPGSYFKSQPRGTHFSVDGGETMVMGANHTCPWKKSLGHHINPTHSDATSSRSAPAFSFSKTRRSVSETHVGHGRQDGGPVKTDAGCLSPGPIYEHHGSMRPSVSNMHSGTMGIRRRLRSSSSAPKVRMVPVEDEMLSGGNDDLIAA